MLTFPPTPSGFTSGSDPTVSNTPGNSGGTIFTAGTSGTSGTSPVFNGSLSPSATPDTANTTSVNYGSDWMSIGAFSQLMGQVQDKLQQSIAYGNATTPEVLKNANADAGLGAVILIQGIYAEIAELSAANSDIEAANAIIAAQNALINTYNTNIQSNSSLEDAANTYNAAVSSGQNDDQDQASLMNYGIGLYNSGEIDQSTFTSVFLTPYNAYADARNTSLTAPALSYGAAAGNLFNLINTENAFIAVNEIPVPQHQQIPTVNFMPTYSPTALQTPLPLITSTPNLLATPINEYNQQGDWLHVVLENGTNLQLVGQLAPLVQQYNDYIALLNASNQPITDAYNASVTDYNAEIDSINAQLQQANAAINSAHLNETIPYQTHLTPLGPFYPTYTPIQIGYNQYQEPTYPPVIVPPIPKIPEPDPSLSSQFLSVALPALEQLFASIRAALLNQSASSFYNGKKLPVGNYILDRPNSNYTPQNNVSISTDLTSGGVAAASLIARPGSSTFEPGVTNSIASGNAMQFQNRNYAPSLRSIANVYSAIVSRNNALIAGAATLPLLGNSLGSLGSGSSAVNIASAASYLGITQTFVSTDSIDQGISSIVAASNATPADQKAVSAGLTADVKLSLLNGAISNLATALGLPGLSTQLAGLSSQISPAGALSLGNPSISSILQNPIAQASLSQILVDSLLVQGVNPATAQSSVASALAAVASAGDFPDQASFEQALNGAFANLNIPGVGVTQSTLLANGAGAFLTAQNDLPMLSLPITQPATRELLLDQFGTSLSTDPVVQQAVQTVVDNDTAETNAQLQEELIQQMQIQGATLEDSVNNANLITNMVNNDVVQQQVLQNQLDVQRIADNANNANLLSASLTSNLVAQGLNPASSASIAETAIKQTGSSNSYQNTSDYLTAVNKQLGIAANSTEDLIQMDATANTQNIVTNAASINLTQRSTNQLVDANTFNSQLTNFTTAKLSTELGQQNANNVATYITSSLIGSPHAQANLDRSNVLSVVNLTDDQINTLKTNGFQAVEDVHLQNVKYANSLADNPAQFETEGLMNGAHALIYCVDSGEMYAKHKSPTEHKEIDTRV